MNATTLTTEEQVKHLSTMTNRDHAGRHFTERYSDDVLDGLESLGLIEISCPVHQATGIEWDRSYWTVEVTQSGQDLFDANPEYQVEVEGV